MRRRGCSGSTTASSGATGTKAAISSNMAKSDSKARDVFRLIGPPYPLRVSMPRVGGVSLVSLIPIVTWHRCSYCRTELSGPGTLPVSTPSISVGSPPSEAAIVLRFSTIMAI